MGNKVHNVRAIRANRLKPAIHNPEGPKAFSPKKGLVFAVNGASAQPPPARPTPGPSPPPTLSPGRRWGLLKIPGGGGVSRRERGGGGEGQGRVWGTLGGGGGAEAPFTAKTSPFFGENAFPAIEKMQFRSKISILA